MRNRLLGLICFVLSGLILYVFISKIIGNFLIPSMQRNLLIAGIVLVFVGFSLLFSKERENIHFTDLLLLLPIVFLLFIGDGRLTVDFASNRSNTFQGNVSDAKEKDNTKKKATVKKEDNGYVSKDYSNIDFKNVDFDVNDITFSGLSNSITYNKHPEKWVGKTIRVSGFAIVNADYIQEGYFAIGKYLISCCAADAEVTGFMATCDDISSFKENGWYEIEGVLELAEDTYGNTILAVRVLNSKKISSDKESLYVFPCFSYGDGSCKEVLKYNLDS